MEKTSAPRGWLDRDFRFVHLRDTRAQEFEYHYHDFDKIVLLMGGKVTYMVEGTAYFLRPGDLLLVGRDQVHRPVIDPSEPYDRIVIWAEEGFLRRHSSPDCPLDQCFRLADRRGFDLMRLDADTCRTLQGLVDRLEQSFRDDRFGADLLRESYFLQLMVFVNRIMLDDMTVLDETTGREDGKIRQIMRYIGEHLREELSVEQLAGQVYISKYHFMRRFKEETGVTVHQYVTQKRLFLAARLLRGGTPAVRAAEECGFEDYSTFVRAFKKTFGKTPREYVK